MPTASEEEEANNEELVHGVVETALNEFQNSLDTTDLNLPETFPTDAQQNTGGEPQPQQEHSEQQEVLNHREQYQHQEHTYQQQYQQQQQQYDPHQMPQLPVLYAATTEAQPQQQHGKSSQKWNEAEHRAFLRGVLEQPTKPPKKSKKDENSKNTGRWTDIEHRTFLLGVMEHGKDCNKIAPMIPTRTILQVRTHAQKYFAKLDKGTSAAALLAEHNKTHTATAAPLPGGNEKINSPIAAQTLLGMSQLSTSATNKSPPKPQVQPSKRKLSYSKPTKSKKSNCCKYRDCRALLHKNTQACIKHQCMLCSFPNCRDFVEEDLRFSQKRELCRAHYSLLMTRPRNVYPGKADRATF